MTSTVPVPTGDQDRQPPPFPAVVVEDALRLFAKTVRAHQLYLPNNPIYLRAVESLRAAFRAIWEHTDEIVLDVTETELRWEHIAVVADAEKSSDSLPWVFFKDGIRELRLLRGVEDEELIALLEILKRVRGAPPEEDDLLTMMWEKDFVSIRYRYVDLTVDAAPPVDSIESERPTAVDPREIEEAPDEADEQRRAGIVSLEDFDATLYFLDEREIEYLRDAVRHEYADDLRQNVVALLLDIFELQSDGAVREEILSILDNLMLHLLSAAQFRAVAYMLRETAAAAGRARDLEPGQRQRLLSQPERVSKAESLAQMLQSLDEAQELPPQEDLNELFEQLRGTALGTVLAWLGRTQNIRLRTLLEVAAARLASSNTTELVRLIGVSDKAVAIEAMRRAGALRTAAAVTPLARAVGDPDAQVRLVGAQALGEIGSPSALQLLERTLEDADRDVRLTSARALMARGYRQALPRLEAVVKGRSIRDADLTEKMLMFETYGALCGEPGVPLLDAILNGKGFLGRREDPETRACAAMALGRVGSRYAMECLTRASGEKEVLVRNAVNRALRGGAA